MVYGDENTLEVEEDSIFIRADLKKIGSSNPFVSIRIVVINCELSVVKLN